MALDAGHTACEQADMTQTIRIKSGIDGYDLPALKTNPESAPRGGVVVIQEIFGITDHIAEMCGVFASAGYAAAAPGLFDRVEKNFHAEHDSEGIAKAIGAVRACSREQVTSDVQAAINALPKPVYVTGFCYGGAMAWLAAARCAGVSAVSCFYGRLIADMLDEKPKAPVMLHYGARDPSIPPENVERVRLAAPTSPLYLYDAGHGFCRPGADYNGEARELAVSRTLDWFARWP
jgi:carboxymethylenebutenolidase